jgi:hypothetical protein
MSISLPHGKTQGKNFFGAEPAAKNRSESKAWDGRAAIIEGLAGKRQGKSVCDFSKLTIRYGAGIW